jgi:hypothetical protein
MTAGGWARKHPVIRISFGDGVVHSREQLDQRIKEVLQENRHQSLDGSVFLDMLIDPSTRNSNRRHSSISRFVEKP